MTKVAITGGIGSGKSYVSKLLDQMGIRVYDCDAAAKRLMWTSAELRTALCRLVGPEVYVGSILQKPVLAKFLLASDDHKQAINDIVHPAVARDFEQSGCDWLESAIFFDSHFCSRVYINKVVCVTAPQEVRIRRVMERDHISREKTLEWMSRQMPQEQMVKLSDYEIVNDGQTPLDPQINELIRNINL
jgi:dephospho-CoA kinase